MKKHLDAVAAAVENGDVEEVAKLAESEDVDGVQVCLKELHKLMSDPTVTIQIIRRKNTRQIFVTMQATGQVVLSISWIKGEQR